MKVKTLRKSIKDLPDDAEILLTVNCGSGGLHETVGLNEGTRRERQVVVWGDRYNTREVLNGYQANDDRYGGSVLLIEVGETSP